MKSQVSEWFKEHRWYIILIALVVLVSVPILITILAPSVSSEISADGMLGYVIQAISAGGTIFLAYVAIRQNEKFKEENDRTQERLEKIAANANELSIVAKIIEYESANIARLTEKTGQYYNACAIDEMVDVLGQGIANICYVIDPETVVLGGGIMAQEAYLRDKIQASVNQYLIDSIASRIKITFAKHKNNAGMLGAFYHFRNRREE